MRGLKEWIKIPDLKGGYLYRIAARNANYGIWIPQRASFLISRIKFLDNFLFEEYHWDCEAFATVKPLEEIEQSPFKQENLNMVTKEREGQGFMGYPDNIAILEYLNGFDGDWHLVLLKENKEKWAAYKAKHKE